MTTRSEPGKSDFLAPSDALLATHLRTLFHLHRAWGHDLRAPLNNLTLITELMRAEIDAETDPAQLSARLKSIKDSTERMTRLLESFLQLQAPLRDGSERCDVRTVLRELETILAPEAHRQRIVITTQLSAEEIPVSAHRDRLRHGCLTVLVLVLESLPTGAGTLELGLAADAAAVRITARGRRQAPPSASPPSTSGPMSDRPSGITREMAHAQIAALGGQLIADTATDHELALTILLPRA